MIGTAAVGLLWRLNGNSSNASASGPEPALEDVQVAGLSTMVTDAYTLGRDDANVVMVEFGDFQCPFCARHALDTFQQLEQDYVSSGKVQYTFRHLPLRSHEFALPAAHAADCAARQMKFWEMRQYLFANQGDFSKAVWLNAVENLGLDPRQFRE